MTRTAQVVTERADPIRVLLVDDHEHVLWGLTKLIDGEWPRMMVIGTAKTVSEASNAMEERRPDVVVLDIYLDGVSSLDHLPRMLQAGHAQVVVLTGVSDLDLHRRAIEFGATAVLLKEAPAEQLLRQIESAHLGRAA